MLQEAKCKVEQLTFNGNSPGLQTVKLFDKSAIKLPSYSKKPACNHPMNSVLLVDGSKYKAPEGEQPEFELKGTELVLKPTRPGSRTVKITIEVSVAAEGSTAKNKLFAFTLQVVDSCL